MMRPAFTLAAEAPTTSALCGSRSLRMSSPGAFFSTCFIVETRMSASSGTSSPAAVIWSGFTSSSSIV